MVQHAGLSRPLSGLAAAMSGAVVDTAGNLTGEASLFEMATLARVMGGRPFDEGKLVDEQYRIAGYKAKDHLLIDSLGKDIKAEIQGRGELSSDTVGRTLKTYMDAGGQPKEFKQFLQRQTAAATRPVAQRLMQKYSNDPDMRQWMDFLTAQSYGD